MGKKKGATSLPREGYPVPLGTDAYFQFLKKCIEQDSAYDEAQLNELSGKFSLQVLHVEQEIEKFKQAVSKYPLMTILFLWAQWISNDKVLGKKYLSMMQELIESDLLPHKHPLDSNPMSFAEFSKLNPAMVIDEIRTLQNWSIEKREVFVEFYSEFSTWLSKNTFGMIPVGVDHDREMTQQRKMPFETYVKFIANLDLRERVLAKIFYLGGTVALEDVLSLQIKDIDFKNCAIKVGSVSIKFSDHVIEDLKLFIDGRKKGFVFTGRNNERINHTVPYRALKTVAVKLGMDPDFTFKEFVKNQ